MRFTVITVCYNAKQDIEKTIKSVFGQTFVEFQYILKDGQSTDGTLELVRKTVGQDSRVIVESCKDNGIYDAMNQALQQAEGEYVFFLNAGDVFHDADVLRRVSEFVDEKGGDIVYGDIILKEADKSRIKKYRVAYRHSFPYLIGGCICHQAMFAKREMFTDKQFDTKYRVCADRDWQLYYLKKNASFKPMNSIVSVVLADGFSMQNLVTFEKETKACLKKYFAKNAWIYESILKVKKYPIVCRLIGKHRK